MEEFYLLWFLHHNRVSWYKSHSKMAGRRRRHVKNHAAPAASIRERDLHDIERNELRR